MAKTTQGFQYTANKFIVVRGEDTVLILHAITSQCQPMSLVGASSVETRLPKDGGGTVTIPNQNNSIICSDPGLVKVTLSNDLSSQLKVGENQTVETVVTFIAYGITTKRIIQIPNALTVLKATSEA
jgi:hypothetical protein